MALCQQLRLCSLNVDDAVLAAWKTIVPSMVERCRTWHHTTECEHAVHANSQGEKPGGGETIPLSMDFGKAVICSCDRGKFPADFLSVSLWEDVHCYSCGKTETPEGKPPKLMPEVQLDCLLGISGSLHVGIGSRRGLQ